MREQLLAVLLQPEGCHWRSSPERRSDEDQERQLLLCAPLPSTKVQVILKRSIGRGWRLFGGGEFGRGWWREATVRGGGKGSCCNHHHPYHHRHHDHNHHHSYCELYSYYKLGGAGGERVAIVTVELTANFTIQFVFTTFFLVIILPQANKKQKFNKISFPFSFPFMTSRRD